MRLISRAGFSLIAGIALLAAACGGDGGTRADGQTEAEAKINNLQAVEKIADPQEAMAAAERQLGYLAAGLWERSYIDVHPTQQVLFTQQQYTECMRKSFGGGAIVTNFEASRADKETYTLPGTDFTEPNAIRVVAKYTIERAGKTENRDVTFNQTVVDGQWRFAVANPADIAAGSCS